MRPVLCFQERYCDTLKHLFDYYKYWKNNFDKIKMFLLKKSLVSVHPYVESNELKARDSIGFGDQHISLSVYDAFILILVFVCIKQL